ETRRLVPERRVSTMPTLERSYESLPEGSLELIQGAEGSVAISWPMIPDDQVEKSYLLAFLTMPLLFGFYMLFWILRYRQSRPVISIDGDSLSFERPGSRLERFSLEATRHEVQAVEFESGALFVTIRGQRTLWISSNGIGQVLKEREVAALYQVLRSWQANRVTPHRRTKQDKDKK
ncbi:MAG: hypothetical protein P1V97_38275, partial [Planctomycetota bacterium]|nr:hypothetical protein [Planctomycetota bacterium]